MTESAQEQGWIDCQRRKDSLEILRLPSHTGLSQKTNNKMFLLRVLAPGSYDKDKEEEKRNIIERKMVTEKRKKRKKRKEREEKVRREERREKGKKIKK